MRLFQLFDSEGCLTGLFNVTISEDKFSNDDVEQVLKDVQDLIDGQDEDAVDHLLDISCIERVFVTEVYC